MASIPAVTPPPPHRCRCRACAPEAFPPAPVGEGYVRADDQLRDGCLEARTGRNGWVLVSRGHRCASGGVECTVLRRGEVRVEGQPAGRA